MTNDEARGTVLHFFIHQSPFGQKGKWFWKGCKPNSVCALRRRESFVLAINTRNLFRFHETWSGPLPGFLFDLAPDGVFRAVSLALHAVRSYRTFSPSPFAALASRRGLSVFCGTVRQPALTPAARVYPAQKRRLRGVAPCGVRTFLPRLAPEAILRPSKTIFSIVDLRETSIELTQIGICGRRVEVRSNCDLHEPPIPSCVLQGTVTVIVVETNG
jgi:hypothetical protein